MYYRGRSPVDFVAGRSTTMRCCFFSLVSCFEHWTSGFCCCTWITLAVLCGNTWIALRITWKMPCLAVSALLSHASLSSLVLPHVCWRYLMRRTDTATLRFAFSAFFDGFKTMSEQRFTGGWLRTVLSCAFLSSASICGSSGVVALCWGVDHV